MQIGEHVLRERLLVLQLVSIQEEDLVGGRHSRRGLHCLLQSMHGVVLGHGKLLAKPGLGLRNQHRLGRSPRSASHFSHPLVSGALSLPCKMTYRVLSYLRRYDS